MPKNPLKAKPTRSVGVLLLLALAVLYGLARPTLNERFGWDLPSVPRSDGAARPSPTVESKVERAEAAGDTQRLYGLLEDLGDRRFLSPSGLLFTPGSAEGHRLDHLRRHVEDDPGRPGRHGVFDGGMEGALQTLDRAHEMAKAGDRTTQYQDDGRTIYTVDMGARIGYVGGREGRRLNNPVARRIRIVLEQNRLITAYPL